MRQLSEGAREIADGNYNVQVPVVRNDELGLLGREFNHMAQEVNAPPSWKKISWLMSAMTCAPR